MDQGHLHKTRYTETNRRESGEEPKTRGQRGNFSGLNTNDLCPKINNRQMDLLILKRF